MAIESINGCVVIPTYNNEKTLERVISGVLKEVPADRLIVVNDGSTDQTSEILSALANEIHIVSYTQNQGKGYALRKGFAYAIKNGFENAITIDSDGQHYPEDIPSFIETAQENKGAVLMGSRNMTQEGVPKSSSFGNRFSNFWFFVETGINLPDTQTGFRLYPLEKMKDMRFYTTKFEFEIEVIVRLAWKSTPFKAIPVNVKYDPEERVSHFRKGPDFFRISVLNSILVIIALLYYYPRKFFSLNLFKLTIREAVKSHESNFSKSISLAFGVFMGIVPIWGFQLIVGIPLAILFKMNKVLFIAAANISIPPMIPFIVFTSLLFGQVFVKGHVDQEQIFTFTYEAMAQNAYQYIIGAVLLAKTAFIAVFIISYITLKFLREDPVKNKAA